MAFEIIKQLARGFFAAIGDNEVTTVSTMPDPPKDRLAVDATQVEVNLGSVSFNTRRGSTDQDHPETQDEHAYVMGQLHGAPAPIPQRYGALYVATRGPGQENCAQRFIVTHEKFQSHVPFYAPNIQTKPGRFYHEGDRFCTVYQDDGHVVEYEIRDADGTLRPESEWKYFVVWTNWHGLVRPLPW